MTFESHDKDGRGSQGEEIECLPLNKTKMADNNIVTFDRWHHAIRVALATIVCAASVAGCGGDFEYKTSGDRIMSQERGGVGEFSGSSTASQEQLMSIQEQYQAKIKAAEDAKVKK